MKIPSKIKIGGYIYKVIKDYKFKERIDLIGQADHDLLEIRLSQKDTGGNQKETSVIEATYIHEVLHCINKIYNGSKLEEKDIIQLGEGLYQVLIDNGMV